MDWIAARNTLALVAVLAIIAAVIAGWCGVLTVNRRQKQRPERLKWKDPLVAGPDAPKSVLTAIATIGPLATTLFTTAGLLEGVIGYKPTAPSTLVLVSTATALVLVGIATMLANTPAVIVSVDSKDQDCPNIFLFVAAAALTGCSAGLALASVVLAAGMLDLPFSGDLVVAVGIVLGVGLLGYQVWSVWRFIVRYALPGGKAVEKPASPTVLDPDLLAGALQSLAPAYVNPGQNIDGGRRDEWLDKSVTLAVDLEKRLADKQRRYDTALMLELLNQVAANPSDGQPADQQGRYDTAPMLEILRRAAANPADDRESQPASGRERRPITRFMV